MAKLTVIGRLGKVEKRKDGAYVAFGVAEPSYKSKESNEYVTPWFNFLAKGDSPIAKFLLEHGSKIDVVEVEANEREVTKDGKTQTFRNIANVNVITWKKGDKGEAAEAPADAPAQVEGTAEYPWA